MTTITTRSGKGSSLSWVEADANFTNLNTDKLENTAIGSTVQAHSNNLDIFATVSPTAAGLALLDDVDTASQRVTLGLGNVDNTSDATKNAATVTLTNKTITTPIINTNINFSGTSGAIQVGGFDVFKFGSDTSGQLAGFRNVLINADFRINQRAYASAAVLATGVYGHDRWKAGASGGDYSFTQLKSSTQITIAAGKSLIQVIEDANIAGGSYVLSWSGTSQARVGLNSATPSGSYAVSPILITGQTAGTVFSVEFNAGTLNKVQLEEGSVATVFEQRPIGVELGLCQRYAQPIVAGQYLYVSNGGIILGGHHQLPVTMRAPPTFSANLTTNTNAGATTLDIVGVNSFRYFATSSTLGTIVVGYTGYATAEL